MIFTFNKLLIYLLACLLTHSLSNGEFMVSFRLHSLKIEKPSLFLHSKICIHIAALGLKCEAGCKVTSDVPGSEMACHGMKVGSLTCDPFLDRCMTTKLKIPGPFRGISSDMEIKNCSSSFVCDPSNDFYRK